MSQESFVSEKLLYTALDMPTFQNMTYENSQLAKNCPRGNIELVQNLKTGLVYNKAFDDSLMVYDENYQNEQSLSGAFISHLQQVRDIVGRKLGKENLIEVGCGKGFFLEMLQEQGFEVHGFDVAYEGNNTNITKAFFNENSGIKGDGIVLRHVLEHIENPLSFLEKLKSNNGGKGLIYIEVPCFDWICENNAWFDICYEHVNYFCLNDLHKAFGTVLESGKLFNGQYIYIVADLASFNADNVKYDEEIKFPAGFLDTLPRKNVADNANPNYIWGASTKGVIFSVLSLRNDFYVKAAVDINPVKQGRYLPVTGIKVISPQSLMNAEKDNTNVYIMNSNYYSEIVDITDNQFNYKKVDNG